MMVMKVLRQTLFLSNTLNMMELLISELNWKEKALSLYSNGTSQVLSQPPAGRQSLNLAVMFI